MKLPAQWSKVPLYQVANVQTGLSKSQNRTGPSVLRPYLRVANVQDGYLDLTDIKEIEVPASQVERFCLRNGDVLLTEGGDFDKLGRGSIWNGEIPDCVHQNHVFAVRVVDRAVLLPEFLACEIQSSRAKNYFLSCAKQTTNLASINSSQIKELPVLVPPLAEQRAIINASAAWDTAIQKTEQLIAAKAKRKAGLMAELLTGRQRVARFQTEWRSWHLGELFQERVENNRNDLPLLSITREEGVVPRNGLERKDTSSEDKSKYLRICPGDIGYNTMRMWQGVSALSRHEGIVSPAYTVCIPGPEIDGRFASYLFKLPEVIHLFYRYSQGLTSDTWNLKFHHFAAIRVRIPEPEEQIAIASILSILDEGLALLKLQREALTQQKRGLMQKLLTGEWRLLVPAETDV
ncbi:restriction endonuclease subunit S [Acidithiobacillus ferriphilus]|uniref:restriction endonuclease subunit S n=1 Tax=Acidithiobacillus ferriphilus TaxID=1689834 RepID=UPI003F50DE9E